MHTKLVTAGLLGLTTAVAGLPFGTSSATPVLDVRRHCVHTAVPDQKLNTPMTVAFTDATTDNKAKSTVEDVKKPVLDLKERETLQSLKMLQDLKKRMGERRLEPLRRLTKRMTMPIPKERGATVPVTPRPKPERFDNGNGVPAYHLKYEHGVNTGSVGLWEKGGMYHDHPPKPLIATDYAKFAGNQQKAAVGNCGQGCENSMNSFRSTASSLRSGKADFYAAANGVPASNGRKTLPGNLPPVPGTTPRSKRARAAIRDLARKAAITFIQQRAVEHKGPVLERNMMVHNDDTYLVDKRTVKEHDSAVMERRQKTENDNGGTYLVDKRAFKEHDSAAIERRYNTEDNYGSNLVDRSLRKLTDVIA